MIFDHNTALTGAKEGIHLCLNVIIPSLFPFAFITTYLNSALYGMPIPGLRFLIKKLRIPDGYDSVLLLGLIGGYPVGAQLISECYDNNQLDKSTAQIMLGYCSNAGPAFIFGVVSLLFSYTLIPWLLWITQIISSILTGILLPKPEKTHGGDLSPCPINITTALQKSIKISATISGWVILFKILLLYLYKLCPNNCTAVWYLLLNGLLELSNGCVTLQAIQSESLRFILCSAFLAFGGICIMLQTASITQKTSLGLYIPGKLIQTALSIMLSSLLSGFLFRDSTLSIEILLLNIFCVSAVLLTTKYCRKISRNSFEIDV